ncbi:MAG: TauD/TfdA family dioxygenase [Bdellovibrionales bacterium]|nr:TauD/TfdA family dioxygenase [Bdellovibrionales bacterium]NQZ18466.1 TauD/TfdA family dioxygenase [Bdellovibrionales bacterium]
MQIKPLKANFIQIDIPLKTASVSEIKEIGRLLNEHVLVLFRNQNLSKDDLIRITSVIGKHARRKFFFNDPEHPEIIRVTNKRDDGGNKLGVFADLELGWHSNGNTRKNPPLDAIALYCVKKGKGGDTYFSNNSLSYKDLPPERKLLLENIKCHIRFDPTREDTFYKLSPNDPEYSVFTGTADKKMGIDTDYGTVIKPLVCVHRYSKKSSLYFCYPVIDELTSIDGSSFDKEEVWNFLKEYMFTEKYVYKHIWQEGDLILNDQWLGFHRRTAVDPSCERYLHRLAFDYSNLLFD